MKSKFYIAALAAVLFTGSAAVGQMTMHTKPTAKPVRLQQPRIIAVQAWVENRTTGARQLYGVAPESNVIPGRIGDRLRVKLVGTDVSSGKGFEVALPANFDLAAGRDQIVLGTRSNDGFEVELRGNGRAQVGYSLKGNVDARPAIASGRLTFEIEGRPVVGRRGDDRDDRDDDDESRREKARRVTSALYRGILEQEARGREAEEDIDLIRRGGLDAIADVAEDLAQKAERKGLGRSRQSRGYQQEDAERVADLYQSLLGRRQSTQELWDRDRGFRGQVDVLHERGLRQVVLSIVESSEFRTYHGLEDFYERGSGRRDGRYDRDRDDRDRRDGRRP